MGREHRRKLQDVSNPARDANAARRLKRHPFVVGKIVPHPGEQRVEFHATLHGLLMGILDLANDRPQTGERRVITSVSSGSPG